MVRKTFFFIVVAVATFSSMQAMSLGQMREEWGAMKPHGTPSDVSFHRATLADPNSSCDEQAEAHYKIFEGIAHTNEPEGYWHLQEAAKLSHRGAKGKIDSDFAPKLWQARWAREGLGNNGLDVAKSERLVKDDAEGCWHRLQSTSAHEHAHNLIAKGDRANALLYAKEALRLASPAALAEQKDKYAADPLRHLRWVRADAKRPYSSPEAGDAYKQALSNAPLLQRALHFLDTTSRYLHLNSILSLLFMGALFTKSGLLDLKIQSVLTSRAKYLRKLPGSAWKLDKQGEVVFADEVRGKLGTSPFKEIQALDKKNEKASPFRQDNQGDYAVEWWRNRS